MSTPSKKPSKSIGVVIMTYGSATTHEHVAEYMQHIYKNKVPEGIIEDFAKRYRLVNGSPLLKITKEQAKKLNEELNKDNKQRYIVRSAMLHSEPFIEEVVAEFRQSGVQKIVGIILSPQFSSFIMEGYEKTLLKAAKDHGFIPTQVIVAKPWPAEPHFVELLSSRITKSLRELEQRYGVTVPVVFTTHSLPERVVAKDPNYLDQLTMTIDAVLKNLRHPKLEWYAAYQSAGHTPEPWLKPDLTDILAKLRDSKQPAVLIVPIQFLADHLEILYDLDIAGREQCGKYGIAYNRIELANTNHMFIEALAALARSNAGWLQEPGGLLKSCDNLYDGPPVPL